MKGSYADQSGTETYKSTTSAYQSPLSLFTRHPKTIFIQVGSPERKVRQFAVRKASKLCESVRDVLRRLPNPCVLNATDVADEPY